MLFNGNRFSVKVQNICTRKYLPMRRKVKICEEQMAFECQLMSLKCRGLRHRALTLLCWQRGRQTCSTASLLHAERTRPAGRLPTAILSQRGGALCFASWSLNHCERIRCLRFSRRRYRGVRGALTNRWRAAQHRKDLRLCLFLVFILVGCWQCKSFSHLLLK